MTLIYDYLIPNYINKSNYRCNTHKKDALTDIYGNLKKMSKQSPTYIVSPSKEHQDFVLHLKEDALHFSSIIACLNDTKGDSAFSYKKVASEKERCVSASIETEDYSNLPEPFLLKVNTLATPQKNLSSFFHRTGFGLQEGSYSFQINTEGEAYTFQIDLDKNTTNQKILNKVASCINHSKAGIHASILSDKKGNKIQLALQSDATGCVDHNPLFTLTDLPSSKHRSNGIVKYYKLNNITNMPTSASFEINGEEKSSLKNDFTLNHSLHITLHDQTEEAVKIYYQPDSQKILSALQEVSSVYNNLIDLAKQITDSDYLSTKMLQDLNHIFSASKENLEHCGVTLTEDKHMAIDPILATKSCKTGDLEALFGNSSPLSLRIMDKMNAFSFNPIEYVNKILVTYPNPQKTNLPNPYITSIYSGLFFSSYC